MRYTFPFGQPIIPVRQVDNGHSKKMFILGVYASAGVEWFVAPKVALGANVNFGVYYEVNPARATTYEGWNTQTMQLEQFTDLVAPASHGFHFGTDNIGASLYMAFYFDTK